MLAGPRWPGFPTSAIFGFASMLVKILTEHGQTQARAA
jgi:hypothetical protein